MKTKSFLQLGLSLISLFVLSGCNSDKPTEDDAEPSTEVVEKETKTNKSEPTVDGVESEKSQPITEETANTRYKLDSEMDQYPDGKFQFNDGTTITASFYNYLEGETFEYASAKFLDGNLVQVQVELKEGSTKDAVLKEWGLTEEVEYNENKYTGVVDIVIDERFADSNISRLPSEWD